MGEWVKKTKVGDSLVSTVRLSVPDPNCMFGRLPGPYETMVFGGKNDLYGIQHHTEKESILHHKKVIIGIKAGIDLETLDE